MVFPTFFNLSLNLPIRISWSEPQSAPGLVFAECIELLHLLFQDGRVMVERSDRMWSTREGNVKPLQYSCFEKSMNSMKRQNDRILKEELNSPGW